MEKVNKKLDFEVEQPSDEELKNRFDDEPCQADEEQTAEIIGEEWRRKGKRKARRPR